MKEPKELPTIVEAQRLGLQWVTVTHASRLLGVTESRIRQMLHSSNGRPPPLKGQRIGERLLLVELESIAYRLKHPVSSGQAGQRQHRKLYPPKEAEE